MSYCLFFSQFAPKKSTFWFNLKFRARSPLRFFYESLQYIHKAIISPHLAVKYCRTRKRNSNLFGTEYIYPKSNSFSYFPPSMWLPFTSHSLATEPPFASDLTWLLYSKQNLLAQGFMQWYVMIKANKVQPFMSLLGSISELPKLWNTPFILSLN